MSGAVCGGDEVGSIVFDIGTHSTKVGYAGEDVPKGVFPTLVGVRQVASSATAEAEDAAGADAMDTSEDGAAPSSKRVASQDYAMGSTRLHYPVAEREMQSPFKDGKIDNWDLLEQVFLFAYTNVLHCDPSDRPVMLCEPQWQSEEDRVKIAEMLFDKFNVPAVYFARNSVLSAFAAGRPTALVVDSGATYTSVCPVYDGIALQTGVRRNRAAGDLVTENYRQFAKDSGIELVAANMIGSKQPVGEQEAAQWTKKSSYPEGTTASYQGFMTKGVAEDYKISVARCSAVAYDEDSLGKIPTTRHEFPNGYNGNFGLERYKGPECLFDPVDFDASKWLNGGGLVPLVHNAETDTSDGVQTLIRQAIDACDVDIRQNLWSSIVVCGANSLHTGYVDRLQAELSLLVPQGFRMKIIAANAMERACCAWIGGSIYASLGSFQQMWIGRDEFKERGKDIFKKRCP